jgi:hypothetical protein
VIEGLLPDGFSKRVTPLVRVGVVDPRRRDVVVLLARTGLRVRDVDHVKDVGTAEAGDLDGAHAHEAKACPGATGSGQT